MSMTLAELAERSRQINATTLIQVGKVKQAIADAAIQPNEWFVIRIEGKDYIVSNMEMAHDDIIGSHLVVNAQPISTVL